MTPCLSTMTDRRCCSEGRPGKRDARGLAAPRPSKAGALSSTAAAAGLLSLLVACGGGGGGAFSGSGGSGGGGAGVEFSESDVLVEPASPPALTDLCQRWQATDEGQVDGTPYYKVGIPDGSTVDDFVLAIQLDPAVRDVVRNSKARLPEGGGSTAPAFVEDDPVNIGKQAALEKVGVLAAHARGLEGQGEVIAVIDTGIDVTHPALAGHLQLPGWDAIDEDEDPTDTGNGIDDNKNGKVDEGVGHGTFVASLIAAIAPRARILPIRALDSDGTGTASTVANAMAMATARGAKIINFSAGLTREIRLIRVAVDGARSAGATVVACAGNRSAKDVDFPADLKGVVAVTSVGLDDVKSDFADWGQKVDLCAPGEDLLGVFPPSPTGLARWSGTSFATAVVSGCVALVRSSGPKTLPPDDVLALLIAAGVNVDSLNPDYAGYLGRRIDVDQAAQQND